MCKSLNTNRHQRAGDTNVRAHLCNPNVAPTFMYKLQEFILRRHGRNRESVIHDKYALLIKPTGNEYYKDQLPVIPAGTYIKFDFTCDSGIYAFADVCGELHRVLIPFKDVGHIDWAPFMDQIMA